MTCWATYKRSRQSQRTTTFLCSVQAINVLASIHFANSGITDLLFAMNGHFQKYSINAPKAQKVCIIGGGIAGTATATNLTKVGIDCVILERQNGLGGLWLDNYPDCAVQTGVDLYEYPDKKYPEHIRNRKDPPCPKAPEICQYLEEYVEERKLKHLYRFGVHVLNVTKESEHNWIVTYRYNGMETKEAFTYVVVCTGLSSTSPNIPPFPGMKDFKDSGGRVIHTSEWKTMEELTDKNVIVVGNGKSALDAAVGACKVAKSPPVQAIRRKNWYFPRYLFGFLHYKFAFHARYGGTLLPQHVSTRGNYLKRLLHFILHPLKWIIWRIMEVGFWYQASAPWRLRPPVGTLQDAAIGISVCVADENNIFKNQRNGNIDVRVTSIEKMVPGGVVFSSNNGDDDGVVVPADVVICGTGWKSQWDFLDKSVSSKMNFEKDGLWLYHQILAPKVSGIAFIGCNIHTFMNPLTHYLQAMWLADRLKHPEKVPPIEEMEATLAKDKAFRQQVMAFAFQRAASIEAYMHVYHDMIVEEMGCSKYRYGGFWGFLANRFLPMYPWTYEGILDPETRHEDKKARVCKYSF